MGAASTVGVTTEASNQLKEMVSRCDNADNELRRSNLLLLGIEGELDESWRASEKKIL